MRTFIGLPISEPVRAQLLDVRPGAPIENELRWTPDANLHLTLCFLGDTSDRALTQIQAGLSRTGEKTAPFSLRGSGLGCFPSERRPSIFWAGIAGDLEALSRLQAQCKALAEEAEFEPDSRPYHPHITLARARKRLSRPTLNSLADRLRPMLAAPFVTDDFDVQRIVLFESQLRRGGSVYREIASWPLG